MNTRILYIFTRTPLHIGAGSSVGAIDQPVQRERHTGFPIIPASSLKGTFADAWNEELLPEVRQDGTEAKVRMTKEGDASDAAWLFGSDSDAHASAGALQFSEAKVLAFPVRSAKGSFAWVTSPLLVVAKLIQHRPVWHIAHRRGWNRVLQGNRKDRSGFKRCFRVDTIARPLVILARAARDGVIDQNLVPSMSKPSGDSTNASDQLAFFSKAGPLALDGKVVLEEYTFTHTGDKEPDEIGSALSKLLADDPVWHEVASRLVVPSDGMMSFFAQNACEVAQHVRINDQTGTAADGGLFNQENVPSESMFYSLVHTFDGRGKQFDAKSADDAWNAFLSKLNENGHVFQFGGDASTGLGYCTVKPAQQ